MTRMLERNETEDASAANVVFWQWQLTYVPWCKLSETPPFFHDMMQEKKICNGWKRLIDVSRSRETTSPKSARTKTCKIPFVAFFAERWSLSPGVCP